eukprot:scaffold1328_cov162-Amphora_coffeaeformis.AAC.9
MVVLMLPDEGNNWLPWQFIVACVKAVSKDAHYTMSIIVRWCFNHCATMEAMAGPHSPTVCKSEAFTPVI